MVITWQGRPMPTTEEKQECSECGKAKPLSTFRPDRYLPFETSGYSCPRWCLRLAVRPTCFLKKAGFPLYDRQATADGGRTWGKGK